MSHGPVRRHGCHDGSHHTSASPYNYYGRSYEDKPVMKAVAPTVTGHDLRRGGMVRYPREYGLKSWSDRGYGPLASYKV